MFLGIVEKSDANLDRIYEELKKLGEITDDLSLLRLEYFGKIVEQENLSLEAKKLIRSSRELQKQGNNQRALDQLEEANKIPDFIR